MSLFYLCFTFAKRLNLLIDFFRISFICIEFASSNGSNTHISNIFYFIFMLSFDQIHNTYYHISLSICIALCQLHNHFNTAYCHYYFCAVSPTVKKTGTWYILLLLGSSIGDIYILIQNLYFFIEYTCQYNGK